MSAYFLSHLVTSTSLVPKSSFLRKSFIRLIDCQWYMVRCFEAFRFRRLVGKVVFGGAVLRLNSLRSYNSSRSPTSLSSQCIHSCLSSIPSTQYSAPTLVGNCQLSSGQFFFKRVIKHFHLLAIRSETYKSIINCLQLLSIEIYLSNPVTTNQYQRWALPNRNQTMWT